MTTRRSTPSPSRMPIGKPPTRPQPRDVLRAAVDLGCPALLVDTWDKSAGTLFDHWPADEWIVHPNPCVRTADPGARRFARGRKFHRRGKTCVPISSRCAPRPATRAAAARFHARAALTAFDAQRSLAGDASRIYA